MLTYSTENKKNQPLFTIKATETYYRAKKNLASAKIVKIEFNANLYLLGFSHFITFKECRKVP